MTTKTCSSCGDDHPATADFFYRQSNKPDGLTSRCKKCHNGSVKKWIKRNPKQRVVYMRRARLRLKYGISEEVYNQMHQDQNGCCALCGRPETKTIRGVVYRLAVDHNHATGKVRALLCNACNNAIGGLQDDPGLLRKAADYIDRFRSVE